jgi:hypothetical protein
MQRTGTGGRHWRCTICTDDTDVLFQKEVQNELQEAQHVCSCCLHVPRPQVFSSFILLLACWRAQPFLRIRILLQLQRAQDGHGHGKKG